MNMFSLINLKLLSLPNCRLSCDDELVRCWHRLVENESMTNFR